MSRLVVSMENRGRLFDTIRPRDPGLHPAWSKMLPRHLLDNLNLRYKQCIDQFFAEIPETSRDQVILACFPIQCIDQNICDIIFSFINKAHLIAHCTRTTKLFNKRIQKFMTLPANRISLVPQDFCVRRRVKIRRLISRPEKMHRVQPSSSSQWSDDDRTLSIVESDPILNDDIDLMDYPKMVSEIVISEWIDESQFQITSHMLADDWCHWHRVAHTVSIELYIECLEHRLLVPTCESDDLLDDLISFWKSNHEFCDMEFLGVFHSVCGRVDEMDEVAVDRVFNEMRETIIAHKYPGIGIIRVCLGEIPSNVPCMTEFPFADCYSRMYGSNPDELASLKLFRIIEMVSKTVDESEKTVFEMEVKTIVSNKICEMVQAHGGFRLALEAFDRGFVGVDALQLAIYKHYKSLVRRTSSREAVRPPNRHSERIIFMKDQNCMKGVTLNIDDEIIVLRPLAWEIVNHWKNMTGSCRGGKFGRSDLDWALGQWRFCELLGCSVTDADPRTKRTVADVFREVMKSWKWTKETYKTELKNAIRPFQPNKSTINRIVSLPSP